MRESNISAHQTHEVLWIMAQNQNQPGLICILHPGEMDFARSPPSGNYLPERVPLPAMHLGKRTVGKLPNGNGTRFVRSHARSIVYYVRIISCFQLCLNGRLSNGDRCEDIFGSGMWICCQLNINDSVSYYLRVALFTQPIY